VLIIAGVTTNQLLDYDSIQDRVSWNQLWSKIWINFENMLRVVFHEHHSIRIDIEQVTNADRFWGNNEWPIGLEIVQVVPVERYGPIDWEHVAGTFIEDTQSVLDVSDKVDILTEGDSFDVLFLQKFDAVINANKLSRKIPVIECNNM